MRALDLVLVLSLCAGTQGSVGKAIQSADALKEVLADKNVWLVEFSSQYCGSCREFEPEVSRGPVACLVCNCVLCLHHFVPQLSYTAFFLTFSR